MFSNGRSDWIRTSGHLNPIQVLYQTEPHPENVLWSGRQDSNLRPLGPKPSALPNCATPRNQPHNILTFTIIAVASSFVKRF